MIYQHNPQTFRTVYLRNRELRIGTVPVGSIIYLQDGLGPFGPQSRHWSPVRRNPWIVESWHPREIGAAGKRNGNYESTFGAVGIWPQSAV